MMRRFTNLPDAYDELNRREEGSVLVHETQPSSYAIGGVWWVHSGPFSDLGGTVQLVATVATRRVTGVDIVTEPGQPGDPDAATRPRSYWSRF